MPAAAGALPSPRSLVLASIATAIVPLALWIGRSPLHLPLLLALATALFVLAVARAEAGWVILIASMMLSPEIALAGAGGGGLDRGRAVILRTEDLVLLLVGVAWLGRMAIHKDLGAVRRTPLNGCIAAYVLSSVLATLIGIETGRVRPLAGLCFVAKYVEYFLIYFMTVNYVRTPAQLRRLLAAILATAGVITAYAWWQIPAGRPSAPFEGVPGEPNTLGGYLVLMFSVACAIALAGPNRLWRRGCGWLAAATLPPLLATLSRSSWMALLVSLAVLLVLGPGRRRLAALSFAGAAALVLAAPQRVVGRLLYTFTPESGAAAPVGALRLDPSSAARLDSWKDALSGFMQHPLTGWGVTGYGFLDAQYFRVLVEIGAFGFVAFVLLLFACGATFRGAWRTLADPLHRALGLGMTAGLAGLMVHAIGTNTFLLIRIMEPFWLLCGLVVAARHVEAER